MPLIPIGSRHVFVDESGDPNIKTDLSGASEYFVLTAVIVDSKLIEKGEALIRQVIQRFFPGGEIKSSRIGNNIRRRRQILEAFSGIEFKHYSNVIDKSKILSESHLRFSKTFVKFMNRVLYSRLVKSFENLHVIADEQGTSAFMRGFRDYLERRLSQRWFEKSSFRFADSRARPFIQVADIIAGTIHRAYNGRDPLEILEPIRDKTILIDEWPPRVPISESIEDLGKEEHLDYIVRRNAVSNAKDFVEENSPPANDKTAAQVAAVQYLLYHFRSIDPEEYITTKRMHHHLQDLGFDLPLRAVRETVIGRLRDHGIVIASSRSGIKLAYCVKDLHAFAEMVGSIVVPYLKRLLRARNHILLTTEGQLDIVSRDKQPDLANFLEGA